jgi:hypothetical protein
MRSRTQRFKFFRDETNISFERFSSRPSRLSFATFAVKAFLFISRQKAYNREDRQGSAKIAKNIIRPTTNVVGEGSTCR